MIGLKDLLTKQLNTTTVIATARRWFCDVATNFEAEDAVVVPFLAGACFLCPINSLNAFFATAFLSVLLSPNICRPFHAFGLSSAMFSSSVISFALMLSLFIVESSSISGWMKSASKVCFPVGSTSDNTSASSPYSAADRCIYETQNIIYCILNRIIAVIK